jgi:hypothetical protein
MEFGHILVRTSRVDQLVGGFPLPTKSFDEIASTLANDFEIGGNLAVCIVYGGSLKFTEERVRK